MELFPPTPEFLKGLRELCDRFEIPLIFEEVQCGLGRIGTNFAYQYFDVEPDIITLAKGLAGGLPMGAVLAREPYATIFEAGKHGSTFGGNPLVAAAALAYCDELFENNLASKAKETGAYLLSKLNESISTHSIVEEIRGLGLMIGIELKEGAAPFAERAAENGLLINATAGNVIRLLPPLITSRENCDQAVEILSQILNSEDVI